MKSKGTVIAAEVPAVDPVTETLTQMLATEPIGKAGEAQLAMWRKMIVMTPELFDKYWKLLGATVPMTDSKRAHYKHLNTRKGKVLQAMRLKNGGGDHGIVRLVNTNGTIIEGTQKDDKGYGISRTIKLDSVVVQLCDKGNIKAHIAFDFSFNETERDDPYGHFAELQPSFFQKS